MELHNCKLHQKNYAFCLLQKVRILANILSFYLVKLIQHPMDILRFLRREFFYARVSTNKKTLLSQDRSRGVC